MKTVLGRLRSKSDARETTGTLAHAGSFSTVGRTTEIRSVVAKFTPIHGQFAPNHRRQRCSCFRGFAEIPAALLSKKLTLKEDTPVKQVIGQSKAKFATGRTTAVILPAVSPSDL